MLVCNYCGGTIVHDLERCPHCGGDLSIDGAKKISIEIESSLIIRGVYNRMLAIKQHWLALVLIPWIVFPLVATIIYMVMEAMTGYKKTLDGVAIFGTLLIMFSVPVGYIFLFNRHKKKAIRVNWLAENKQLKQYDVSGKRVEKVIDFKDIAAMNPMQSPAQSSYGVGTILIEVKSPRENYSVELKNISDFNNSYTRLKDFVNKSQGKS